MIDDYVAPSRRKPKTIEPIKKPVFRLPPLKNFDEPEQPAEAPLAIDGAPADTELTSLANVGHFKAPKKPGRFHINWPPSRRTSIILGVAAILVAFGSGAAWTHFHRTVQVSATVPAKHIPRKPKVVVPTTVASNLTGLQVDPTVNQRPVTGVMIENSIDARPQSGLDQAGVVFEAIAEGGITRFLALYQDGQPTYIGPVRSARPYYVQWCMGFDCSLAHVGGSPEALNDITAWGTKNLDQFYNSGAYARISSRYAPHNVYTSTAQLNQLEASKGYGASSYTGFVRKADSKAKTPNAGSIDMAISGGDYNTHYDYDPTTNSYKRSEAGMPHMEVSNTGVQAQITPKVVIAMVMQYGLEADDHHSQYNVIGNGQAYIFQDGTVTPATWSKGDIKAPLTFTDAAGQPVKLNAGQTWLTALSAANQLTYK